MVIGLGIDEWLFKFSDGDFCNNDCKHCTEEDCEDRLADYEETID